MNNCRSIAAARQAAGITILPILTRRGWHAVFLDLLEVARFASAEHAERFADELALQAVREAQR